jgi:hypothetical protein
VDRLSVVNGLFVIVSALLHHTNTRTQTLHPTSDPSPSNRSPIEAYYCRRRLSTTMAKLISIVAAAIAVSTPGCHAFVAPGSVRATDVRLGAKLEGREIEGALTPTNNFVLVKVADIQDQTEGGIILTGSVSSISSEMRCEEFFAKHH